MNVLCFSIYDVHMKYLNYILLFANTFLLSSPQSVSLHVPSVEYVSFGSILFVVDTN